MKSEIEINLELENIKKQLMFDKFKLDNTSKDNESLIANIERNIHCLESTRITLEWVLGKEVINYERR